MRFQHKAKRQTGISMKCERVGWFWGMLCFKLTCNSIFFKFEFNNKSLGY